MNRAEYERLLKLAQGSVAGRTEEVVSFDGAASKDGVLGGREEATLTDADGTARLVRLTSIRLDDAGRVVGPESFAGQCRCGSLLSTASAAFCAGCRAVLCHRCAWGLGDGMFCGSCWLGAAVKWLLLGKLWAPARSSPFSAVLYFPPPFLKAPSPSRSPFPVPVRRW